MRGLCLQGNRIGNQGDGVSVDLISTDGICINPRVFDRKSLTDPYATQLPAVNEKRPTFSADNRFGSGGTRNEEEPIRFHRLQLDQPQNLTKVERVQLESGVDKQPEEVWRHRTAPSGGEWPLMLAM